jgi:ribosomal biogenesis protein LAS1
MPSLGELKRASQHALTWLWEWYWSQLEEAFSLPSSIPISGNETRVGSGLDAVQDKLQTILKSYIKTRKSEIKTRRSPSSCTAASTALSTYTLRFSPTNTSLPPTSTRDALLHLLVDSKMILPMDKKLGSSMSGAFLIWSPILLTFSSTSPSFFPSLLKQILQLMNQTDGDISEEEKEGMCEWAAHMLVSEEWAGMRKEERAMRERVLGECFSEPKVWNLRLAERLVDGMGKEGELWRMVLEASRSESGEMDVAEVNVREANVREVDVGEVEEVKDVEVEDIGEARPVEVVDAGTVKKKVKGPQKVVGLWKPRPIGWLPEGWDEDA